MRRLTPAVILFPLTLALLAGCPATTTSTTRKAGDSTRQLARMALADGPRIVLDASAPPYLVGKTLNLPPPIEGDFTRLVSIPTWACRAGSTVCSPCNRIADCDIVPPVEPGVTLVAEEAWIDEGSERTIVRIVSAYVRR